MAKTQKVNPERKRARYSKEFRAEGVRSPELGQKPAARLAFESGISRNQLYKWQEQLRQHGAAGIARALPARFGWRRTSLAHRVRGVNADRILGGVDRGPGRRLARKVG